MVARSSKRPGFRQLKGVRRDRRTPFKIPVTDGSSAFVLNLLDRLMHQFVHGAANLMVGLFDGVGVEVAPDLAEYILVARLVEIGPHNFLGILFSLVALVAEQPCSPQTQQLVAPRGCLEPQLLVMRELVFKTLLALVECAHTHRLLNCANALLPIWG